MNPIEYLEILYDKCIKKVGSGDEIDSDVNEIIKNKLDIVLNHSEKRKGVITVLFTSLIYKSLNPKQDVRKHQSQMDQGYSGRTFDTKYITPFLQNKKFPAPSETGWLTRSLETNSPYYLDYKPNITPKKLKTAFLELLDLAKDKESAENFASYLLQGLIIQRNSQEIDLAKPTDLPISVIINLLTTHFNSSYTSEGASRLPVLALYAVYQCLINEAKRFEDKKLLNIESHTSADSRSGRIGDVDIVDAKNRPFEAVEVKFGIPINSQLIRISFEKFKTTQVKRYYLLSTDNIDETDKENIIFEIEKIKKIHGCNVIANGLINSLNYYLRLISDTSDFISNYVDLVENDSALKFEHKQQWNKINSIR